MKKRIIPCLDIKNGRTVKGVNFVNIQDAGDPIVLAKKYEEQGADELVFLDITATIENRETFMDLVKRIALEIQIPFTIGGGINSVADVRKILNAGAQKVSINTAAVQRPELIQEIVQEFGSQSLVIAIDTDYVENEWRVLTRGGQSLTALRTIDWAKQVEAFGAGEILLTSINEDGTKNGFSLKITKRIAEAVSIPVIASGGAGNKTHFKDLFLQTKANAGLAASVFHYGEIAIPDLKKYLIAQNIDI